MRFASSRCRSHGLWRSLTLVAGLFVPLGCGDPYEPAIDLVAGLATAEVVPGPDAVRPVRRDERRGGWHEDERRLWGTGGRSVLDLRLEKRQPLTLEFRCAPVPAEAPVASLSVTVNGVQVGPVSLEASAREYVLALPERALREGRNRFVFTYRGADSRPIEGAARAVEWDYIRLRPLGGLPVAVREGGKPMLYLPYGVRVDYYFELRTGARLAVSQRHFVRGYPGSFARAAAGDARGGLDAELQIFEGPTRRLGRLGAAETVPLSTSEAGLARLSLRAEAPPAAAGGILLVEPRIEVPATSPPPTVAGRTAPGPPSRRPNILLYVIDTLRADHLGCYGYARDVSPNIDALAAEALTFEQAVAQSSWTKSAMASVFTGLFPTAHGVQAPEHLLASELQTLAEMLRDAGYRTAGFAANGHLTERQGFAQGFDFYAMSPARAPALHEQALAWLGRGGAREPFFLYIHTQEPHGPYAPPEEQRRRFAPGVAIDVGSRRQRAAIALGRLPVTNRLRSELEALYDAEIAANDAELGRLLASLKERGVYEETLVILLSDHGEAFFERGYLGHGKDLHEEVLRVPLILKLPAGRPTGRVASLAQQADVLPTIAAFLGLPLTRSVHGRDLLADLGVAGGSERIAISHMARTGGRAGRPRISLIRGDWKLIEPLGRPLPPIGHLLPGDRTLAPRRELYHLGRDPEERQNLAARFPALARHLAIVARAEAMSLPMQAPDSVGLSPRERRHLEALGYLQ